MAQKEIMPLGVFTSIGAGLGASLEAVKEMGVPTVQVHAPAEMLTEEDAARVKKQFAQAGVEITLMFCGYYGESYKTIQIVRETVGLVPLATRDERIKMTRQVADFAALLGIPGIAVHIGFVSEDHASHEFAELVGATKGICDYCSALNLCVNLETGQETADTLLHFLKAVNRPNLGVNFDPANMILYGSGEPLEALRKVGSYVRSTHCKDGVWSDEPGVEWGKEVPVGEGDVNIEEFLRTLIEFGYTGPLTIEREIKGEQQAKDIKMAINLLTSLKKKLLR